MHASYKNAVFASLNFMVLCTENILWAKINYLSHFETPEPNHITFNFLFYIHIPLSWSNCPDMSKVFALNQCDIYT